MTLFRICAFVFVGTVSACASMPDNRNAAALSELAPTGKLRAGIVVGQIGGAAFAARDTNGQPRGVSVDLARGLASKLGVPLELVTYPSPGPLVEAGNIRAWDVAFLVVDPKLESVFDFSPPYALTEVTYLVLSGSSIGALREVDRTSVRVAAIENSVSHRAAVASLKAAKLILVKTPSELEQMARSGDVDVITQGRGALVRLSASLPGTRVLPGSIYTTQIAIAVAKQKLAALAYVSDFIEEAKISGSVRLAAEKAGLEDVILAPPSRKR
jgi:polar amino acid transport system substrate-binding protein